MVEVRGVEPLCPEPLRAASTFVEAFLVSLTAREATRASVSQRRFESYGAHVVTTRRAIPAVDALFH